MTTLDLIQDQLLDLDETSLQEVYRLIKRLSSRKRSLTEQLTILQNLCQEEDYVLEIPHRSDRPNSFTTISE